MKKITLQEVLIVASFLFFSGVLFSFLQNDFWQDEVYTLVHFVYVPLHTTLTDYHSTNNHILFSFLANIIVHLFNYRQLSELLLHPYLLRSIPVIVSLLTVILFYIQTKKEYTKSAALLCSSIWLSTFPLICFSSQLRGYSLSILIVTLQYFSFTKTIKAETVSLQKWLLLFLYTSLSLLCLPTNIYIELSYLLLCFFLLLKPTFSIYFFNTTVRRSEILKITAAIVFGCLWTSLYYKWMLQQQPANEFITTFHPFQITNLLQALAIFYHFTGYRFYLILGVAVAILMYATRIKKKILIYKPTLLPLFLFFVPFVFFFIHGAIIIQRTFLSLIPFFVLLTGLAISEFSSYKFYYHFFNAILVLNLLCIVITCTFFIQNSKTNNITENHQQDLVQHYYLVHFNELQASLLAKKMVAESGEILYLRDGFGQTGIDYYLHEFNVPFLLYNDSTSISDNGIILTNLKKETENDLRNKKINYTKIIGSDYQYNLFQCHSSR